MKDKIKAVLPRPVLKSVQWQLKGYRNAKWRLSMGFRIEPLNRYYKYNVNLLPHRNYTDWFLEEFSADIRGHCLEFFKDEYAHKYGGNRIKKLDIINRDPGNPNATIVADLCEPNGIPDDTFDSIICTYTLHVVFDHCSFIRSVARILKPGGVLLIVVPCISPIYHPNQYELWRFTPLGLQRVLEQAFSPDRITLRNYGNKLIACGDMHGLPSAMFTEGELKKNDDGYPITVAARAIK